MLVIDSVKFFRRSPMAPGEVTMLEVTTCVDAEIDLKACFEIEATPGLQESSYLLIDAIDAVLKEHLVDVSIE